MEKYLRAFQIIDWKHPDVLKKAEELSHGMNNSVDIARACFMYLRDEIKHSNDYQLNPVTCKASDVLKFKTGYCQVTQ